MFVEASRGEIDRVPAAILAKDRFRQIVLVEVEVKTGDSALSRKQRQIRQAVDAGRIKWFECRIENGTPSSLNSSVRVKFVLRASGQRISSVSWDHWLGAFTSDRLCRESLAPWTPSRGSISSCRQGAF